MESTIWLADGFVVLTGEIGAGKTTLIESFLSELPENVVLAQINQTQLTPVEFLQALLVEFEIRPYQMKKVELLARIKDFMLETYAAGKTLLLVVDEAQNLSRRVLEEIRMLSGIEAQKEKFLRIVLAGQPELATKLDSPALEQLSQRVRLRFHLSALSKRETREYIEHRLEVAGAKHRNLVEEGAFETVFRYTGGVPRLINVLCDTAMLCAFADDKALISDALVTTAVEELQWAPYEERMHRDPPTRASRKAVEHSSENCGFLELRLGNDVLSGLELSLGRIVIGRTVDNDLQIPSKFVSRHHAQITTNEQGSILVDLNSTNGMVIGSRRIKHHYLNDGDVVQVGEHILVYHELRDRTSGFETLSESVAQSEQAAGSGESHGLPVTDLQDSSDGDDGNGNGNGNEANYGVGDSAFQE
jgi:general secretion pathway protein A